MRTMLLILGCLFLLILALREPQENLTDTAFRLVNGLVGSSEVEVAAPAEVPLPPPPTPETPAMPEEPMQDWGGLPELPELDVAELPEFYPDEMDVSDDSLATIQALYKEAARLLEEGE